MPTGAITGYVDVAQLVLYAFFLFFAGLVFYLRREDRREGYPLEDEAVGLRHTPAPFLVPSAKAFRLAGGEVTYAPQAMKGRDDIETGIPARKLEPWPGAPYQRTETSLAAGVGPGSWVDRHDVHDRTWDEQIRLVPLRVAKNFVVHELGPNPIGMTVFGSDDAVAGVVTDLWVDRGESLVRYYEVELPAGGRRLMPATFCRTGRFTKTVKSEALLAAQFADIPGTRDPDSVTFLEEERIVSYFGAGTLYATPARAEPLL
ncbi:photosynthetic reaction center subunit H [Methylobacterium sp. NEAU 140]|uniref:photosynthetic reaction center subunit H n=1 Tax=Methylobacterium sp. NEAU 140 TaxID=3064945 RepID=UPI0027343EE0|nr:photosynthetic reaction center subunit H [Methylobacterium sp. NEAU 140]MDP4025424.1 photosynthetic reaction center subunit H [Methylobacterium sp. NEAU 140]